ncbi:MAG TPA: hypothetical protein VFF73_41285 [Planctomycetota bacterium]|nr:hypothetical protein [Planctomycetota bacterium]
MRFDRRPILIAFPLALLLLESTGLGFSSFLQNHVHSRITVAALSATGFAPSTYSQGSGGARWIDVDQPDDMSSGFTVPRYHCTRDSVSTDRASLASASFAAFEATAAEVRARRAAIVGALHGVTAAQTDRIGIARAHLGYALHAIQDAYAHSNWVDLDAASRSAFESMIIGNVKPDRRRLARLSVCSWVGGLLGGSPTDGAGRADLYPHDAFCKDDDGGYPEAVKPAPHPARSGETKRMAAEAGAYVATIAYLASIEKRVTAREWDLFRGVPAPVTPTAARSVAAPGPEPAKAKSSPTPGITGTLDARAGN